MFTREEIALVYGKSSKTSLVTEEPSLLRASVQFTSAGRAETAASAQHHSLLPRLLSIRHDAEFVRRIALRHQHLPLVANLRQGAWYCGEEAEVVECCRFRSTDGHAAQWTFHLSRSNVPLVELALRSGGAVLVDATRSVGKTFPDSFARSVPLWCAIVNLAMGGMEDATIDLPPWLPPSESSKISAAQLAQWAQQLRQLLPKDLLTTPTTSVKRLKPYWIANLRHHQRDGTLPELNLHEDDGVIPIVCVSCSCSDISPEQHRERHSWAYVPGAADDEENWALGLTHDVFWRHHADLLAGCADSHECEKRVRRLLLETTDAAAGVDITRVAPGLAIRVAATGPPSSCAVDDEVDLTWLCAMDKTWSRRNADAWRKAVPEARRKWLAVRGDGDLCVVVRDDTEWQTGVTMCIALLASSTPATTGGGGDVKQRVRVEEAKLVASLGDARGSVPRRLIKEILAAM